MESTEVFLKKIPPLNVSRQYLCIGLKTFLNLSPTVVLANENVLTGIAEVTELNIKLEFFNWCLTRKGLLNYSWRSVFLEFQRFYKWF